MPLERFIIHLNVADFAVAVERVCDSRLRKKPVVVASADGGRAAVYDMSEEAYQDGVRKGMLLGQIKRICRHAHIIPCHPDRYERAMKAFFRRAAHYTPLIEAADDKGHLYLDVTGTHRLFGPPPDIAWRVRKTVRRELDLDPIWAVAPNKLVAKVASRLVKPTGEYIVGAGEEKAFLAPHPITLLPGVAKGELQLLSEFHIGRIGEAASLTLSQMGTLFGRRGKILYDALRGDDTLPVAPPEKGKPKEERIHLFAEDTNNACKIEGVLRLLVEEAAAALRRRRLVARRVGVFLYYADGRWVARQAGSSDGSANDFRLYPLAHLALQRAWTRRIRIRRLRLVCDRLAAPAAQLELFPRDDIHQREKEEKIVAALDAVRQRFGRKAISPGQCLAA